jgi:hypothetical protein
VADSSGDRLVVLNIPKIAPSLVRLPPPPPIPVPAPSRRISQ